MVMGAMGTLGDTKIKIPVKARSSVGVVSLKLVELCYLQQLRICRLGFLFLFGLIVNLPPVPKNALSPFLAIYSRKCLIKVFSLAKES